MSDANLNSRTPTKAEGVDGAVALTDDLGASGLPPATLTRLARRLKGYVPPVDGSRLARVATGGAERWRRCLLRPGAQHLLSGRQRQRAGGGGKTSSLACADDRERAPSESTSCL